MATTTTRDEEELEELVAVSSPEQSPSRDGSIESAISLLSPAITSETASAIRHLAAYTTPLQLYPAKRLAGVLVLLHVNPLGGLSVTLTTRSLLLRSHPGETALPGGRFEPQDPTVEATALREANEEIGLPIDPSSLLHLTTLPAYTSRTLLVVIPSVYLLLTIPSLPLLQSLVPNPSEVDAIFNLALKSFLMLPPPPSSSSTTTSTPDKIGAEVLVHSSEDLVWLKDRLYRLHHFSHPSAPSQVWGLTADIIVAVALVAQYGLSADEEQSENGEESGRLGYGRWAERQMTWKEIVENAMMGMGRNGLVDRKKEATDQRTRAT
ncbi:hypothetical protein RQP46_003634 [Phenoliferia psychrophenolica]